jgi:hypothetical protein
MPQQQRATYREMSQTQRRTQASHASRWVPSYVGLSVCTAALFWKHRTRKDKEWACVCVCVCLWADGRDRYWINQQGAAQFLPIATSKGVPIPLSSALPTQVELSFVIGIYRWCRDCILFLSLSFYEYALPNSTRLKSPLWPDTLWKRKGTKGVKLQA